MWKVAAKFRAVIWREAGALTFHFEKARAVALPVE